RRDLLESRTSRRSGTTGRVHDPGANPGRTQIPLSFRLDPMNRNLALRVLGDVMRWTDERATEEFRWLRLISTAKYDDYSEFLAGVRFIESLAAWLQQFRQDDRETAYSFVRNRLVYIGSGEMQHLVELAFPESMRPILLRRAAT